jgi:pimeloyl-ACP methyl ester carboxylesterase
MLAEAFYPIDRDTIIPSPLARFDSAGPAGAPAIVLVHGSVVTRKMWFPQMKALSDSYHVLAPDLPGHGVRSNEPFTMDGAVKAVYEAVNAGGGQALLVGISLGGYVAMAFARRYPARVPGLVVASASRDMTGFTGRWMRLVGTAIPRVVSERSLVSRAAQSLEKQLPTAIANRVIDGGLHGRTGLSAFTELAGTDFRAMLRKIPAPVLFLNGENDRSFRADEAAFVEAAPYGKLQVIPGAGHLSNLIAAEAFSAAVRGFAQAVDW